MLVVIINLFFIAVTILVCMNILTPSEIVNKIFK